MIKKYELTLLLDASTSETELKNIDGMLKKFDKGAKLDETSVKRLAYPIGKHEQGRFVYYTLSLDNDKSFKLSEKLQNDNRLLRYLLITVDQRRS